jgi:FAD/FMN-containing dehydrogenase
VEASVFAAGLPLDAGAALLIELDGIEAGLDEEAEHVKSICLQHGARDCRLARDDNERKKLWAARKGAFGAIGRISPDSMIQDAVVPRSQLPQVLASAYRIASKYQLRIANVFHAGDGNLHPLICFDSRSAVEVHNVKEAGRELMETCVRAGGSITGEHGVGFDKRELLSLIFSDADMEAMLRVRAAFDQTGLCNPGKILPMLRGCGEARAVSTSNVQRPVSNALPESEASASARQAASNAQGPISDGVSETREVVTASSIFDSETARNRLAQLVGEENMSASPRLSFYPSALTVSPGSIAEVCEVMKLASSEGWTVVPAGGMTWLSAGQPLKQVELVISMQRLNHIVDHEPADLIAVTEAGVTLDNLNRALAQKGQWLPLDPPDDGRASIGGIVATGLSGAQQFGYGAPRRHVIGMKVVLADGTLIKVGGRVVKNVAGYDLCKLLTGSYGTLGVIVEVNFKLRPVPFETRSMLVSGEREDLLRSGREIIHSRLFPVAVELLSPAMAHAAGLAENAQHLLMVKFDGSSTAVKQQISSACELTTNINGESPILVENNDERWRRLASLPLQFEKDLVWRAGLPPADVPAFLAHLEEHSSNNKWPKLMWQASLGDGRVRAFEQLRPKAERGEPTRDAVTRLHQFRSEAERRGGRLTIECAPDEVKRRITTWGNFGSASGIMRRIKQQLDPKAILSPDRFGFEKLVDSKIRFGLITSP